MTGTAERVARRDAFPATAGRRGPVCCTVTALTALDHARAAWAAAHDGMALDPEEYAQALDGLAVTLRVPPAPGEAPESYGERAASAVMAAYVAGWPA